MMKTQHLSKKISLTQGKFTIVDDCDYDYLMQWKWYYRNGYAVRKESKRTIHMHRVILERMDFKDFISDHINRDKLDNCRCNLRPATNSQNRCNRNKPKNNTSGYIGVCWYREKWHVSIQTNGKRIYLGCYVDKEEAALAYDKAARKYHGEFAVLNEV